MDGYDGRPPRANNVFSTFKNYRKKQPYGVFIGKGGKHVICSMRTEMMPIARPAGLAIRGKIHGRLLISPDVLSGATRPSPADDDADLRGLAPSCSAR
jgi:hypothetical protein